MKNSQPLTCLLPNHRRMAQIRRHHGFSLLEVVIATAILMGSAIVLSRLAGMGREQAQKAARYATAQQLCEQTLNEVLLGQRSVQPVEDQPLLPLISIDQLSEQFSQDENRDDGLETLLSTGAGTTSEQPSSDPAAAVDETNPEWLYSLRTEPRPETPGLWILTVEVRSARPDSGRPVRFALTRWIFGSPPAGAFDELQFRSGPDDLDSNAFSYPDSPSATSGGSAEQ